MVHAAGVRLGFELHVFIMADLGKGRWQFYWGPK